jgi:protease-4
MNTAVPDRLRRVTDRRRIAVITIRGVIGGAARGADTLAQLDQARRNANIRAVLLDIDSPGGGAIASDQLHAAVRRLARAKPVVAWFRGTGASGAYFLACGATRIAAFPGAVVGSIGVISVRPVLIDLMERVGAAVEVTKTGEFKDLGAPWRRSDTRDREHEQRLVDAVFVRFTDAVRAARGFDKAAMDRVTTGEVWLGTEALLMGLVDELIEHEDEAIAVAQRLAGMTKPDVIRLSRRPTLAQRLGVPMAGMSPIGATWLSELAGWDSVPRVHL